MGSRSSLTTLRRVVHLLLAALCTSATVAVSVGVLAPTVQARSDLLRQAGMIHGTASNPHEQSSCSPRRRG